MSTREKRSFEESSTTTTTTTTSTGQRKKGRKDDDDHEYAGSDSEPEFEPVTSSSKTTKSSTSTGSSTSSSSSTSKHVGESSTSTTDKESKGKGQGKGKSNVTTDNNDSSNKKTGNDGQDDQNDQDANDNDDDDEEEEDLIGENEQLDIAFEARVPEEADFFGIKSILEHWFLGVNVATSEIADLIVAQAADDDIGSVIKVTDAYGEIYGVVSALNLQTHKSMEFVKQIRQYILSKCSDKSLAAKLTQLFSSTKSDLGLIVNEKFINIPYQLAPPLLNGLRDQLLQAKQDGKPYNLENFLFVMKAYKDLPLANKEEEEEEEDEGSEESDEDDKRSSLKKPKSSSDKKKNSNKKPTAASSSSSSSLSGTTSPSGEIEYVNEEDEVFLKHATFSFTFPLPANASGVSGVKRSLGDSQLKLFRTVAVLNQDQLQKALEEITELMGTGGEFTDLTEYEYVDE